MLTVLLGVLSASAARADDAGAPTDAGTAGTSAPGASESVNGCVRVDPLRRGSGQVVIDTFPTKGFSGYAATLSVTVEHGKGETVLPNGLALSERRRREAKALKDASFVIPDQDGGAAARLHRGDRHRQDGPRPDRARGSPSCRSPRRPGAIS